MRIVLLAYNLRVAGGLSVGRSIVFTLPQTAPEHEYLMVVPDGVGYPDFVGQTNVTVVSCLGMGLAQRWWWEHQDLHRSIKDFRPDWIWALGNYGLRHPPCRQSILFHDPHLVYPESHYSFESLGYRLRKRLLRRLLATCLPGTEHVFCQTETSRLRFAETFDYPVDHIGICPNALASDCDIGAVSEMPVSLIPFADRFKLLVLTRCYGHKNLDGILRAYKQYRDQLADTLCVWTIAPDQHPIAPRLLAAIDREGLQDLVLNVGPIPQNQVKNYFHACDALLLPTLLESFSGTYVEAMHYERPIITSNLDFAHEVCGDAAHYVDPWSPESIRDGICRLRDDRLYAGQLVERGRQRCKMFLRTWPDIVRGVLDEMGIDHE